MTQRQLFWILIIEVILVWIADRRWPPEPKPSVPSITSFTALPSTITFTSSDPDLGATGSAIVTITVAKAMNNHPWTLTVQASSSTLTNCTSVPVSAIRASCSGVVVSGTGGVSPTGSCSAPFSLSTAPTQLAGGNQGNQTETYTINVAYPFNDNWQYSGASSPACSLTLSYTATAN
jgi:hypothetical protein